MGTILIIIGICAFGAIIVLVMQPMSQSELNAGSKLKPGQKLINSKGVHYTVDNHGRLRNTETIGEFLSHPKVQKQLNGFHRMYMQQTLRALYEGEEPPNSVGGYGVLTKKKLMSVWDDGWQAELDSMNEYYDVTYNSFFDIPEDHPSSGILLTTNEIIEQYGSEEKS